MKSKNETVFRQLPMGFLPTAQDAVVLKPTLPVGTYSLLIDPDMGWYFKPVDNMTLPSKIYGKTNRYAERIINTFKTRDASTGLFLVGDKGTGKTLLSKTISNLCLEEGFPTVLINHEYTGDSFNTLVQSMNTPTIFIFDEFEKVYDNDHQEKVLTLFDGVFPTKHMFILTTNDSGYGRTNDMLRNRPGRMFYSIKFKGLDSDFVREYAEDVLLNKSHINDVVKVASIFGEGFNFDILKALVEEMNRYNETAMEAIEILNADPFANRYDRTTYTVELFVNGHKYNGNFNPQTWQGSPLSHANIEIDIFKQNNLDVVRSELFGKEKETEQTNQQNPDVALELMNQANVWDEDNECFIYATRGDLVDMDAGSGSYKYEVQEHGLTFTVRFKRKEEKVVPTWMDAF